MESSTVQADRKQRKILILANGFLPKPSANGVCLHNIAKEYVKKGYQVYCIAMQEPGQPEYEVIDDICIYRLKRAWFISFHEKYSHGNGLVKTFEKIVHLMRNICMAPFYPNVAPIRSMKFYALAKKIVVSENIDTVIASFVPYETIYTVLRLKKAFGNQLFCISYYLDYLWENRYSSLARVFYSWKCFRAQKKDLRILDRVIIPITSKKEFEKQYGKHANVDYLELPVYEKGIVLPIDELQFSENTLNFAFIGSLNTWNRSPKRLLELLQAVSQKLPDIKLHIWGDITNTGDILRQYDSIVEYHGYTESKYIPTILQKADWVVNISNARDYHLVPSKIFQLFASGKPVLNYMFHRTDGSSPYFRRYPNTYTVYDDQADDPAVVEELVRALQRPWPPVNADDAFTENTPKAVAEKLLM